MGAKEARKLVADALRSGKYKQTKDQLHVRKGDKDEFCCLGVACQVFMEQGGNLKVEPDQFVDNDICYDGSISFLPHKVGAWLEMDEMGTFINSIEAGGGYCLCLTDCNDEAGMDFGQIADLFETQEFGCPTDIQLSREIDPEI